MFLLNLHVKVYTNCVNVDWHSIYWLNYVTWIIDRFVQFVFPTSKTWHLAVGIRFESAQLLMICLIFVEIEDNFIVFIIDGMFLNLHQVCRECGPLLSSCPICRRAVETRINLYWCTYFLDKRQPLSFGIPYLRHEKALSMQSCEWQYQVGGIKVVNGNIK